MSDYNGEAIRQIRQALFDHRHRTVLVSGPPGSGKTWLTVQLAAEASRLVTATQDVLVLTFSVNAADQIATELRQQRRAGSASASPRMLITNYHSLYRQLLDAYVRYCGVPAGWRTWLPHEVNQEMRQVNEEARLAIDSRDLRKQWELSNATSIEQKLMDCTSPWQCQPCTIQGADRVLRKAYGEGLLHYDSWPYFAQRILRESASLRDRVSYRYPFVFVDEFQDTNGVEWEFLAALTHRSTLVCMCDPEQAIYVWKGADPAKRLDRLLQERKPENRTGFRLTEQPRLVGDAHLRQLGEEIRACSANRDPVPTTVWAAGVSASAVVKHPADQEGVAQGEWPVAYAVKLKSEVRPAVRAGKRIGVLCPTWSLLQLVSDAIRKNYGDNRPLYHSIAGLDSEVGAFLGALTHALSGRCGATTTSEAALGAELALESMRRIAGAEDAKKVWWGPQSADPSSPNKKRRDRVRDLLMSYATAKTKQAGVVDGLSDLAEGLLASMRKPVRQKNDDKEEPIAHSIWLVDPFLPAPLQHWLSSIGDFIRRNPEAGPEECVDAAWGAVEACVACERRVMSHRHVTLMTWHAAKGKQFHQTYVCGASKNARHADARDGGDCDDVRNLQYVVCTRSSERILLLYRQGEPSCILSVLLGNACKLRGACSPQLCLFTPGSATPADAGAIGAGDGAARDA